MSPKNQRKIKDNDEGENIKEESVDMNLKSASFMNCKPSLMSDTDENAGIQSTF